MKVFVVFDFPDVDVNSNVADNLIDSLTSDLIEWTHDYSDLENAPCNVYVDEAIND